MEKLLSKRVLSVLLSALLVLCIVPFVSIKANAATGIDDFVNRCYSVALGRQADPGGFDYWTNALQNGERVGYSIVQDFIFSEEYLNKGKSDEEFLDDLYYMFMGRKADDDGYKFWKEKMDEGMTREKVFEGFAVSPEFSGICAEYDITAGYFTDSIEKGRLSNLNNFVSRMYLTTLNRGADFGGQQYWIEQLASGNKTAAEVAVNFLQSKEFKDKKMDNSEYLDILYRAFMGRLPDPSGKNNWLEKLDNAEMTREAVFKAFIDSQEFAEICNMYGINKGAYEPDPTYEAYYRDSKLSSEYFLEPVTTENGEEDYDLVKTIYYYYDEQGNLNTYSISTFENTDRGTTIEHSEHYDAQDNLQYIIDGEMWFHGHAICLNNQTYDTNGIQRSHNIYLWDCSAEDAVFIGMDYYNDIDGTRMEERVQDDGTSIYTYYDEDGNITDVKRY